MRTPSRLTPFTLEIPMANPCSSKPFCAASSASFRTAQSRTLIDDEPSLRTSSETRQALTVALEKPGRGSRRYQAANSSRAILYVLRVLGEETLSKTSLLSLRHLSTLSTTVNSSI